MRYAARRRYERWQVVETVDREKVNEAFKRMRKVHGLIARQGFACCGSCAGYDIATQYDAMDPAKRKKVRGVVTYNRQDRESMMGGEALYLQYGRVETSSGKESPLTTEEVGALVVEALRFVGLPVEWDGTAAQRIVVPVKVPVVETPNLLEQ